MAFSHERLEVYRLSIAFVTWVQPLVASLPTGDPGRAQLQRAATSIPLNIAEGNAKRSKKDRARFWQIALGSTFECAAVLDVIVARELEGAVEVKEGKELLERTTAMLMGLLRGIGVRVIG